MNQNVILCMMLISYSAPIFYIYNEYNAETNKSISSIITSDTARPVILGSMIVMAIFTCMYEYNREIYTYDKGYIISVFFILIGIFGVICIPESNYIHYIFGATVFFSMIAFMMVTCRRFCISCPELGSAIPESVNVYHNLMILLYFQFILIAATIIELHSDKPIFSSEALFILNFAIFYIYLHFCE